MSEIYFIDGRDDQKIEQHIRNLKKNLMQRSNKIQVLEETNTLLLKNKAIFNKNSFDLLLLKIREMWRKSNIKSNFEEICNEFTNHVSILKNKYIIDVASLTLKEIYFEEAYKIFDKNMIVDELVRPNKIIETWCDIFDDYILKLNQNKASMIIIKSKGLTSLFEEMKIVYKLDENTVLTEIQNQGKFREWNNLVFQILGFKEILDEGSISSLKIELY